MTQDLTGPRLLQEALAQIQCEFSAAELTDVRLEYRMGERHDHCPSQSWTETQWSVQVGNDHGRGASMDEALAELRKEIGIKAQIPERAERIAAILREIPDEAFARYHVVGAAQELLEKERRERR